MAEKVSWPRDFRSIEVSRIPELRSILAGVTVTPMSLSIFDKFSSLDILQRVSLKENVVSKLESTPEKYPDILIPGSQKSCVNSNNSCVELRSTRSSSSVQPYYTNVLKVKRDIFCAVTPEKIDFPSCLVDTSPGTSSEILPVGAKNVDLLEKPTYKKCKYFEGSFIIPVNEWNLICKNNKLDSKNYPFYLRKKMSQKL